MAKFSFTNRALDDLIEIWDYTAEEWSENQAEKYYNLIMASSMDLANNPQLCSQLGISAQEKYLRVFSKKNQIKRAGDIFCRL